MLSGGDAAETFVRMALSGTEIAVRLTGSAAKNALAFLLAAAKNHKKVYGKMGLPKLLKAGANPRGFTMTPQQFKAFKKYAHKYKVLYAAVKDRHASTSDVVVMVAESHLEQANQAFRQIQFVPKDEAKRENAREEATPKKDSRSERDSSVTKDRSRSRNSSAERKNEHPSVEGKLKDFKAKEVQHVPTAQKKKMRTR